MIKQLEEIRSTMYDILTIDGSSDDSVVDSIRADQRMHLALTQAVKREGVNIFQLQHVVTKKTIMGVVCVLKVLDSLEKELRLDEQKHAELKAIEAPRPDSKELLEMLAAAFADKQLTMAEVIDTVKVAYLAELFDRYGVVADVARAVGFGRTYTSRLMHKFGMI